MIWTLRYVNSFYFIVIVIWWLHSFDIIFPLFACGKHLHDCIISRRAVVLSLFIEVSVPNQENVGSSICELCYLFCLFLWFFYCIMKLYRDSSVFCFSFNCCTPGKMASWPHQASPAVLDEKSACIKILKVFDPWRKRFHYIELVLK